MPAKAELDDGSLVASTPVKVEAKQEEEDECPTTRKVEAKLEEEDECPTTPIMEEGTLPLPPGNWSAAEEAEEAAAKSEDEAEEEAVIQEVGLWMGAILDGVDGVKTEE